MALSGAAFNDKHPRGFHGRFGRATTKRSIGGNRYQLKRPMTPKTRALKEAATEHHNTMLVKKYVHQRGDYKRSALEGRFAKARRVNQLGGIFPRTNPRAAAHTDLWTHHPGRARLSWMSAPR